MISRIRSSKTYIVLSCIILALLSMLSLADISITVYIFMILLWMMVLLVFSKTCKVICDSGRQNQILFIITFFCGTGFYIKASKTVYAFMDDGVLFKIAYGISAYFLIFVIMVSVVMFCGCLLFKRQKQIR